MTAVDTKALFEAQEIMWTAIDLADRTERVKLAEKALSLSADCADAYTFLAYDREKTSAEKIAMFEEAVKAGFRTTPARLFKDDVGMFWGLTNTRPYMRALFGLAQELQKAGRIDEAIRQYRELLRLNPSDNQGVRYLLIPLFISLERYKDALSLAKKYSDDCGPEVTYSLALLLYKKHGDCEKARAALGEAVRWNRHVVPFLLASGFAENIDLPSPYITVGGPDEAYQYALDSRQLWHKTPGALEWLIEILVTNYIEHQKLHV